MAAPKKRTSHSKRNMRRAHDALTRTFSNICPKCAEPKLRHRACPNCGEYRGKQIGKAKSND